MMTQKRKTTTKSDLKEALTRLLEKKDFEAISVSDIAREAGVNRGTFYLHYVDKFDMMDQLIDEILQNILLLLKEGNPKNKEEACPGIWSAPCQVDRKIIKVYDEFLWTRLFIYAGIFNPIDKVILFLL